jgi:hypothetical protein
MNPIPMWSFLMTNLRSDKMTDGTLFRGLTPLSPSKDVEKTVKFYVEILVLGITDTAVSFVVMWRSYFTRQTIKSSLNGQVFGFTSTV